MNHDTRFEEVRLLLQFIEYAKDNQLEVEFLDTFLLDYHHSHCIGTSIQHAAREWDL